MVMWPEQWSLFSTPTLRRMINMGCDPRDLKLSTLLLRLPKPIPVLCMLVRSPHTHSKLALDPLFFPKDGIVLPTCSAQSLYPFHLHPVLSCPSADCVCSHFLLIACSAWHVTCMSVHSNAYTMSQQHVLQSDCSKWSLENMNVTPYNIIGLTR